jgi:5-methylcytosine-specific restriction endonuclease McrA
MMHLNPPTHNDHVTINELRSSHYAGHGPALTQVAAAYAAYLAAHGNVTQLAPITLSDVFKEKFKKLYESKREALNYISLLREAEDVESCPMCGSSELGTLDHIFPKSVFPEFSIYSKNLVPACFGCNLKRNAQYSNNAGGRVLHPYFDAFMNDRLIYTRLSPAGGTFDRPRLDICLVNPGHGNATEILFHVDHVIRGPRIINKQIQIWTRQKRRVSSYLRTRTTPGSDAELMGLLDETIENFDDEHGNKNNWKSMLFYGIRMNKTCRDFLRSRW